MASATLPLSIVFISMVVCVLAHSRLPPTISLHSTLTAGSQNFKWVSPNGEFAFGFHSVAPPLYSVGIWFENISDFTFAWTAKTDDMELRVEKGSTLHLSASGIQVLDSQRKLKWVADPLENENGSVSAAAILNNGNFVLFNRSAAPIWQSFDEPTDTLLPGQTLRFNQTMFCKASDTNFSSGRFGLTMNEDRDVVIYLVERPEDKGAYWSTTDEDTGAYATGLKFDRTGRLYLVNDSDLEVAMLSADGEGGNEILRRVTLDTDGVLRLYVWNQMASGSASWSHVWQVMDDPCKVKGLCGLNSYCHLTDLKKHNCLCPPGFDFVDTQDTSKGCGTNSSQEYSCSAGTEMVEIAETDWADGNDYSTLKVVSESECMEACSDDCMCTVVTFKNSMCYKKRLPLMDGRQGSDITSKAFVKVTNHSIAPYSPSSPLPRAHFPNATKDKVQLKDKDKEKGKIVLMVGVGLVACSSILAATTFLLTWFFRSSVHDTTTVQDKAGKSRHLKAYSYKEIQAATGGFKEEIGRGSFGKVYRGELPNGRAIAVKALDKAVQEGQGEKEFRTEVSIIGTSHHRNLVQLYGFCDEGEHKFLVYQFMSNGSLDGVLFVDSGFLSWELRVEIAIGAARGILYLHEECATQIIHCDIKPQNILLDEKYSPKISDFGLAKLMKAEHTRTFTAGARGTKGYMAPEWHRNVAVTVKVDVYSFGVMLLEIICCRKTGGSDEQGNEILLCDWVYDCLKNGGLVKVVEQQELEGDTIEPRQLERMVLTALWCIQDNPALRPSIKKVVQMLEGTVQIAVPPPP